MASIYVQGVYTSLDKVGSMYSVFIYDLSQECILVSSVKPVDLGVRGGRVFSCS